jgi:hypothetical protein
VHMARACSWSARAASFRPRARCSARALTVTDTARRRDGGGRASERRGTRRAASRDSSSAARCAPRAR